MALHEPTIVFVSVFKLLSVLTLNGTEPSSSTTLKDVGVTSMCLSEVLPMRIPSAPKVAKSSSPSLMAMPFDVARRFPPPLLGSLTNSSFSTSVMCAPAKSPVSSVQKCCGSFRIAPFSYRFTSRVTLGLPTSVVALNNTLAFDLSAFLVATG